MERVILFDGTRMHISATGCTQADINQFYEGTSAEKKVLHHSSNLQNGTFEYTVEFGEVEKNEQIS